jgi:UDP-glucose 4-epimerase
MKVLVTGAAGFIGSHLAERLDALGHEVRGVDDLSTGRRENLAGLGPRFELVEGDLADGAVCARAVQGVEAVLHQAAVPSVLRSIQEPARTHRANVEATVQLFEASRHAGVRRVVYAASSSVYGDSETLPKHEQMPAKPLSPYAVQKHAGELYGRVYSALLGLPVVCLRYFNVFGPRQDPASEYSAVIPRFVSMLLRGERPTVYGDGTSSRDFVYVEDVVHANLLALDAPGAPGHSFNVGTGERVSLDELVSRLNAILGTRLPPLYLPERAGDLRHSLAAIDRARSVLGYEPKVPFDEGLRRTVQSLRTPA